MKLFALYSASIFIMDSILKKVHLLLQACMKLTIMTNDNKYNIIMAHDDSHKNTDIHVIFEAK